MKNYAVERYLNKKSKERDEKSEFYKTEEGQKELQEEQDNENSIDDSKILELMKKRDNTKEQEKSSDFRRKLLKKLIERKQKLK